MDENSKRNERLRDQLKHTIGVKSTAEAADAKQLSCHNLEPSATPSGRRSSCVREERTRELRELGVVNEMRMLRDRKQPRGARQPPMACPSHLRRSTWGPETCSLKTPVKCASLPELSRFKNHTEFSWRQGRFGNDEPFKTSPPPVFCKAPRSASISSSWRQNVDFEQAFANSTVRCVRRETKPSNEAF